MLSYDKNKQQMCWVNQHQCRSRQMWKIFTCSPMYTQILSVVQNDLVIFCNRQKWIYWVNLWIFSNFGDFYTYVEWLNTSVVFLSIRGHTNELKVYHEQIVESRQVILYYRQNVSVLGEHVKIFHIWRLLHWCWLTQHICCLFLS